MRGFTAPVLFVWVAIGGCLGEQRLDSPCRDEPVGADPAFCSACMTDDDCHIVGNPCNEAASCVPTTGNWVATSVGCEVEYSTPPPEACGCVAGICAATN
ncbi:MAG: hypothetical protein AAFZ18_22915 [Myxococcota bacterium]